MLFKDQIKLNIKNNEFCNKVFFLINNEINNVRKNIIRKHVNLDKNQLLLYSPSTSELEIYSLLPDNNILTTKFIKKDWGTWNIQGWYIVSDNNIPSKSLHLLAGGGTDWEYVFRVAKNFGDAYVFSGGNHGRESLEDIRLLNAEDGSELKLQPGEKVKINALKIVENTFLTFDEALTQKYSEVQRTYIIFPTKILLETDFNFIYDVYMGTSYVCMFPTTKEHGRYIRFDDTARTYETPKSGDTLTENGHTNYLGYEKSLSATIWGDSVYKYEFKIQIDNIDMVDGFKNKLKTFYWDVNKIGNKLYFSKFDNDEYKKIEAGTTWHNVSSWEINLKN